MVTDYSNQQLNCWSKGGKLSSEWYHIQDLY